MALLPSRAIAAVVAGLVPVGVVTTAPTAAAADAVATTLAIEVPAEAFVDTEVAVTATLTRGDTLGTVGGAQVDFERRVNGVWSGFATATTNAEGSATATFSVRPDAADNAVRASYAGSTELASSQSEPAVVQPRRRAGTITIDGPARIVDETTVPLQFHWVAGGRPVPGVGVVWRRLGGGEWRRYRRVGFGADGRAGLRVGPRADSRWRVVGREGRWWQAAGSGVHRIDNVPPGDPVAYPAAAPRPRVRLPRQSRAVGAGPNARVTRIPNGVWRSMVGRSWHRGCPVGRGELRLVRINYWGYDGYRHRGELVVRDDITRQTVGAFGDLYRARLPIRAMYRVDRFGWSDYLHGGNDYRSMAAGNTSGFNCRGVVGNPGVPSPHSYGRAIDLNTWENPYHSQRGIVPNAWWASRSHPRIAWRSGEHPVVRIMRANGFRWTYGARDSQHFDG